MARNKSFDEIVAEALDYLRIVQPNLDTKPGAVARDLFVDLPADMLAKLYSELQARSAAGNITLAIGSELDKLALNYGKVRLQGAPSKGIAVFLLQTLDSDVLIPLGTKVSAKNGLTFQTSIATGFFLNSSAAYQSTALRMLPELNTLGLNATFALEVPVTCTSVGTKGNIEKGFLINTAAANVSNVTNLRRFTGGTGVETNEAFRSRILTSFNSNNLGTKSAYEATLKSKDSVFDVKTVGPGSSLMIRDGSLIQDGYVVSFGSGGKTDIYLIGSTLLSNSESYIFRDKSNENDVANSKNNFILGQEGIDPNLNFFQRRASFIDSGFTPRQPVKQIASLAGSLSGSNFKAKYVDGYGITKGNYELKKDTGSFNGSAFGFDSLSFISDYIELDNEQLLKSSDNSVDPLTFTDITKVRGAYENVSIIDEGAYINSDSRSLVYLNHKPIVTVSKIINKTTGERYVIKNQMLNANSNLNEDGYVIISGSTLPLQTDVLLASYIWRKEYKANLDFDGLKVINDLTLAKDSIDWSYSNKINREVSYVEHSVSDGYFITVDRDISKVINVFTMEEEDLTISDGKVSVSTSIFNIDSIKNNDEQELFNTYLDNGSFSGTIINLPSDSVGLDGSACLVKYNKEDIFSPGTLDNGSFSSNVIYLDNPVQVGTKVYVDYSCKTYKLLDTIPLSDLPITTSANNLIANNAIVGEQITLNEFSGSSIQSNKVYSPSYIKVTVTGNAQPGKIGITGTTFYYKEIIMQAQTSGLTVDLSSILDSEEVLVGVEECATVSVNDYGGATVIFDYDLLNSEINDAEYSNGKHLPNASLTKQQLKLIATESNLNAAPAIGDYLRVKGLFIKTSQSEKIYFTVNQNIQFTKNKYFYIDKIQLDSGFADESGTISLEKTSQPAAGNTYFVNYDYTAPKQSERLTITYNYNQIVGDCQLAIEDKRPVSADVLVKEAEEVLIDVVADVTKINSSESSAAVSLRIKNVIIQYLSSLKLGQQVDYTDLINAVYADTSVQRVNLSLMNKTGLVGVKKFISISDAQYARAGNITVNIEG